MIDAFAYYPCAVCDQKFRFGPHAYDGRPAKGWNGLMVCNKCEKWNWDGVVPTDSFLKRLKDAGVEPALNEKGFVEIPSR